MEGEGEGAPLEVEGVALGALDEVAVEVVEGVGGGLGEMGVLGVGVREVEGREGGVGCAVAVGEGEALGVGVPMGAEAEGAWEVCAEAEAVRDAAGEGEERALRDGEGEAEGLGEAVRDELIVGLLERVEAPLGLGEPCCPPPLSVPVARGLGVAPPDVVLVGEVLVLREGLGEVERDGDGVEEMETREREGSGERDRETREGDALGEGTGARECVNACDGSVGVAGIVLEGGAEGVLVGLGDTALEMEAVGSAGDGEPWELCVTGWEDAASGEAEAEPTQSPEGLGGCVPRWEAVGESEKEKDTSQGLGVGAVEGFVGVGRGGLPVEEPDGRPCAVLLGAQGEGEEKKV